MILRIEDTDQKREVPGAVGNLIKILNWVGITFDEGPAEIGGDYGPYIQSQRLDIYKKHVDELLEKGGAYHCFCTSERLQDMRKKQEELKLPPRYDRACRDLDKKEVERRIEAGEKYVIRQKMPLEGETVVHDELRGDIKFKNADLDDQVLIKSNGVPTYQFANVVDDHLMEITHVSRAEEWISSFPKNILLYQSFGWVPPLFIHFPLVLNKEGGKLSKRQGDVAVEDYRDKGYLPEALINFCTLLGWHPKGDNEIFAVNEAIKAFDYHDMGASPAVFDVEKLDYFNGYYIRQKNLDELTDLCLPFLQSAGLIETNGGSYLNSGIKNKITGENISFDQLKKIILTVQERLKKLSEVGELTRFYFLNTLTYLVEILIWKKSTTKETKDNLNELYKKLESFSESDWTKEQLEAKIIEYIKSKDGKVGDYLWPMRVALTGLKASPGPFEIADVLGKSKTLGRIKLAIGLLDN